MGTPIPRLLVKKDANYFVSTPVSSGVRALWDSGVGRALWDGGVGEEREVTEGLLSLGCSLRAQAEPKAVLRQDGLEVPGQSDA